MINANGPGFAGLYAGDVVEFTVATIAEREIGAVWHPSRRRTVLGTATRRAAVLPLLVFQDHVQVKYTSCGYTVNASNFVRLVRRGKRHMAADRQARGTGYRFDVNAVPHEG